MNRDGGCLYRVTRRLNWGCRAFLHRRVHGLDARAHPCIAKRMQAVQHLSSLEPDLTLWLRHLQCGWSVKRARLSARGVPSPQRACRSDPVMAAGLPESSDGLRHTYHRRIADSYYTPTWAKISKPPQPAQSAARAPGSDGAVQDSRLG